MALADVFQLCCPRLSLHDIVSLCQSSKQVKAACLDQPDQQLQQWLQQAIKSHPCRLSLPDQHHSKLPIDTQIQLNLLRPYGRTTRSICWLIRQCCRSWGLLPLASRLQLQKALLAAQDDPVLSALLISAGARVTEPLLISAAWEGNPGPLVWVRLQQFLGVSLGLPEVIFDFCPLAKFPSRGERDLQLFSAEYLLDLAAVTCATPAVSRDLLRNVAFFLHGTTRWSPEQHERLLRLLFTNAERSGLDIGPMCSLSHVLWLDGMKALPIAVRMELLEAAAASGYGFKTLRTYLGTDLTHEQALRLCRIVLESPTHVGRVAAVLELLPSTEQLTDVEVVLQLLQLAVDEGSLQLLRQLVQVPAAEQLPPAAAEELLTQAADSDQLACWCLLHRSCCAAAEVPLQSLMQLFGSVLELEVAGCEARVSCCDTGYRCSYCTLLSVVSQHPHLGKLALGDVLGLCSGTFAGLIHSQSLFASMDRLSDVVSGMTNSCEQVEQVLEYVLQLDVWQQGWFKGLLPDLLGSAAGQQLGVEAVRKWVMRAIAGGSEAVLEVLIESLPAAVAEVEMEELVKCCAKERKVKCLKVLVEHHPGMKGLGVEQVCKLLLMAEGGDPACMELLEKLLAKPW